jgi:hypothetical protein
VVGGVLDLAPLGEEEARIDDETEEAEERNEQERAERKHLPPL